MCGISFCGYASMYIYFVHSSSLVSAMRNYSGQPIMDKQPTGMANTSFWLKSV